MWTFRLDTLVQTILRLTQTLGCAGVVILALKSLQRHFVFSFFGNSFDTNVKQQRVSWGLRGPFTDWLLNRVARGDKGPFHFPFTMRGSFWFAEILIEKKSLKNEAFNHVFRERWNFLEWTVRGAEGLVSRLKQDEVIPLLPLLRWCLQYQASPPHAHIYHLSQQPDSYKGF